MGGENLYQYTPNPTGWIDPLGLSKKCCGGGATKQGEKDGSDANIINKGPEFKTSQEAIKHAETMGYKEVKGVQNKAKKKVLYNNKGNPKYISRDADGHIGGAYKGASTIKNLNSKKTRSGTYDKDLNWIGD